MFATNHSPFNNTLMKKRMLVSMLALMTAVSAYAGDGTKKTKKDKDRQAGECCVPSNCCVPQPECCDVKDDAKEECCPAFSCYKATDKK